MPVDMDPSALTAAIRAAALEAGEVIMEVYRATEGMEVEAKGDGSPVTKADQLGEQVILRHLRALTPDIPVVAEEEAAAGRIPDLTGDGPFWVVDPLDGTKEFIKRNGEFTVNIALVTRSGPLLGVIYAPALGETYAAHGPGTAVMALDGGADQPIRVRPVPAEGLSVIASRSHATPEALADFLQGRAVASTRSRGSSLKFCEVAKGAADLYPRLGPTCEWDIAAGHAVLDGAGGKVTHTDGTPFIYGKAPTFLNPHFVAWGWV